MSFRVSNEFSCHACAQNTHVSPHSQTFAELAFLQKAALLVASLIHTAFLQGNCNKFTCCSIFLNCTEEEPAKGSLPLSLKNKSVLALPDDV